MKKDSIEEQIPSQSFAGIYEINLSYYWRPMVLFLVFVLVAIKSIYMIFPYAQIMTAFISSCGLGLLGICIGFFWHSKVKKTAIPFFLMACFMIIATFVLYMNIPEFIQTMKNLNSIRTLNSDDIDQVMVSMSDKTVCISKHQFINALLKCMSKAEIIHLSHKVPTRNFKLRLKKKNGNSIEFDGKYFPDMTDDFVISIKPRLFYTDIFIPNGWFYIGSICENAKSDKNGAHEGLSLDSGQPINDIFSLKK